MFKDSFRCVLSFFIRTGMFFFSHPYILPYFILHHSSSFLSTSSVAFFYYFLLLFFGGFLPHHLHTILPPHKPIKETKEEKKTRNTTNKKRGDGFLVVWCIGLFGLIVAQGAQINPHIPIKQVRENSGWLALCCPIK